MGGESPVPVRIGVLSDDLTGANGVAAMFAARGVRARTLLGPAVRAGLVLRDGVTVVDTATRDAGARAAATAVDTAMEGLRRAGVGFVAKRIDTTLRGNIGAEVAALLAALGGDALAVMVPAAPEAGRTAVGGRVLLDGRPLWEAAGLEDDAPALMRRCLPGAVAHVGLEAVRTGPAAVARAITRAAASRARVVVCDAAVAADIETIAAGVARSGVRAVPVDPGRFTLALAMLTLIRPGHAAQAERAPAAAAGRGSHSTRPGAGRPGRPVLAVFGSRAPMAAEQVRIAQDLGLVQVYEQVVQLAPEGVALPAGQARKVRAALQEAGAMAVGVRPVLARAAPSPDSVPQPGLSGMLPEAEKDVSAGGPDGSEAAGAPSARDDSRPGSVRGEEAAVAAAVAAIVSEVLADTAPAGGLYLSGGATAAAVLRRLGAAAVDVDTEVLSLAAGGRIVGGACAGLPVVTKGGMIGGPHAIAACLRHLRTGGGPGDDEHGGVTGAGDG